MAERSAQDEFVAALIVLDVELPLRIGHETGLVIDARGREVFTVDMPAVRSDEQVSEIAIFVATTMNRLGGFRVDERVRGDA